MENPNENGPPDPIGELEFENNKLRGMVLSQAEIIGELKAGVQEAIQNEDGLDASEGEKLIGLSCIGFDGDMAKVFTLVSEERGRQNSKWGVQKHFGVVWFLILAEEVGEVAKAMLHTIFGGPESGCVKEELIQVAAVAVQWLEHLQRGEKVDGADTRDINDVEAKRDAAERQIQRQVKLIDEVGKDRDEAKKENASLSGLLATAEGTVCSMLCESVKGSDREWVHVETCKKITEAIKDKA